MLHFYDLLSVHWLCDLRSSFSCAASSRAKKFSNFILISSGSNFVGIFKDFFGGRKRVARAAKIGLGRMANFCRKSMRYVIAIFVLFYMTMCFCLSL